MLRKCHFNKWATSKLYVPRAPICALAYSNGIDTLVNTTNTLLPEDLEEQCPRRRCLRARCNLFMASNFSGFHTSRKSYERWIRLKLQNELVCLTRLTHSSISLCNTTTHASEKAGRGWVHTHGRRSRLNFRCGEQKHTTFRRSFDPCLKRKEIRGGRPSRYPRYTPMG
jgi:hypothetical protein